MKSTFVSCLIWWLTFPLLASTGGWTESFESGLPSTAPSTTTQVVLTTGSWTLNQVYGKTDNGSMRACMTQTGAVLQLPSLDKPTTLSFQHRSSGNYKVLIVEKSTDGGGDWTEIGRVNVGSASSYGSASMAVNEPGTNNTLIRFVCQSPTIYLDNVTVSLSTMGDEPTIPATVQVVDSTGTSVRLSISGGDGDGRLVAYSKTGSVTWQPIDGTSYSAHPVAVDAVTTAFVSLEDDTVEVTGLEPGETYHVAVFEYNGKGVNSNYLTSKVARLVVRTLEVPSLLVSAGQIDFGSHKVGTSVYRRLSLSGRFLQPMSINSIWMLTHEPFSLSLSQAGPYTAELELPFEAPALDTLSVFIRFQPTALVTSDDSLILFGGAAQAKVHLRGTGSNTDARLWYISPDGNDAGNGSFDVPWYNLQVAVDSARAGDTIVCRGGIYYPTFKKDGHNTTVRLATSGSATKRISIVNYPDEQPVFNFKHQPKKLGIRGMLMTGDYWYLRGLHITEAGDNGIKLEGNHNRIERCTFSYNDDTGLQLGFGHDFSTSGFGSSNDGSHCAWNDIIDCDSYLNCDADNFGSDADGFACKMHNGKGNRFIRCRAWDNADDAWDLYETDYPVYILECWAWGSGRAENFDWVQASGSFQGNGNGIKLGGNGTGGSSKGKHVVYNTVAFNCNKTGSVKGFDQNSHGDGVLVVNCLGFGNGKDFMFEKNSYQCEYYNNVCFGEIEIAAGSLNSHNAMLSTSDEAWTATLNGFTLNDYESLTESDAKAPRGLDGSLPPRFARLKSGSVLLDKGRNLPMPFLDEFPFLAQPIYGNARDLGPYERQEGGLLGNQVVPDRSAEWRLAVTVSTHNQAVVHFNLQDAGRVVVSLYDVQGRLARTVAVLKAEAGLRYALPFDVSGLTAGCYVCRLTVDGKQLTTKLMLP